LTIEKSVAVSRQGDREAVRRGSSIVEGQGHNAEEEYECCEDNFAEHLSRLPERATNGVPKESSVTV
jgi:hypothetical protein